MAENKNQHYVPQCYLKAFIDWNRPEQMPLNVRFNPLKEQKQRSVWISDKSLKSSEQTSPKTYSLFTSSILAGQSHEEKGSKEA